MVVNSFRCFMYFAANPLTILQKKTLNFDHLRFFLLDLDQLELTDPQDEQLQRVPGGMLNSRIFQPLLFLTLMLASALAGAVSNFAPIPTAAPVASGTTAAPLTAEYIAGTSTTLPAQPAQSRPITTLRKMGLG